MRRLQFDFVEFINNDKLECIVTICDNKLKELGKIKIICSDNLYSYIPVDSSSLPYEYMEMEKQIKSVILSRFYCLKRTMTVFFWEN